jgi:ribokinase
MPRIVVVGSANVDIVVVTERLPVSGETVLGGTLLINHGGKGAKPGRRSMPARR